MRERAIAFLTLTRPRQCGAIENLRTAVAKLDTNVFLLSLSLSLSLSLETLDFASSTLSTLHNFAMLDPHHGPFYCLPRGDSRTMREQASLSLSSSFVVSAHTR